MWIAECGVRSKIQKSGVRIQNSGDRSQKLKVIGER